MASIGGIMQVSSIVINSLSIAQWTALLVTGRYMITMMMLLCYVNLSGGQRCTDSVIIEQGGDSEFGDNRLAIFQRLNFTCNGRITSIRARVRPVNKGSNYPSFQVWQPLSVNSTVYDKIGEVQLQSDDQVTGSGNRRTINITLTGNSTIEFQSGDVVGYYHPPDTRYRVRDIQTDGYILYRFDGPAPSSVNLSERNFMFNFRQPLLQFTIEIRCHNFSIPANGMMSCSSGRVGVGYEGDTCSFTCNTGYELTGNDTRTCQSNGSWSGSPVSCIIMECPPSSLPMNSMLAESCNSTYQSMCELQCQEGFNGTGDPSYVCDVLSNGSSVLWTTGTGVGWTCLRVQCCSLLNGTLQCPNGATIGVFEDTCRFSCNAGYELQGSNNGTCLANQSWSGGDPICVVLNCSTSPPLNNSQLQSSCDTQYQSTCTTVCVDGYTGVGGSYTCVVTDEDTNSVGWSGSTSCHKGSSKSRTAGAVIGGAIGGSLFFIILILLVVSVVLLFIKCSKHRKQYTTSVGSRLNSGENAYSQSYSNEMSYSVEPKPLPQPADYEEAEFSYLIANTSVMYENTAVQHELLSSSCELPSISPYDLAESLEAEQQIYETPYEDEENYGPIYSAPSSDEQKIYEEFEGKRFRKLYHRELKLSEELGTGEFGVVTHGKWTPSSNQEAEVAIKTLNTDASDRNRLRFLQEAAIMCQFDHQNVIKLHGVVTETPAMIVLEYMSRGDLRNLLLKLSGRNVIHPKLPIVLLKFCQEVAAGMAYLSGKQFVHRDLAARNILVSESTTCKIADFGMSRDLLDENYYITSGGKIPVKWTAPEAMYYKKYSVFSDVWSYGCVLYEIWSLGHKPFEEVTNEECLEQVDSGYRLPPPPGCPRAMYRLMMRCWNPKPRSRPQFGQISKSLQDSNTGYLLSWSDEDKQNNDNDALKLGNPLEVSSSLFYDLQTMYN